MNRSSPSSSTTGSLSSGNSTLASFEPSSLSSSLCGPSRNSLSDLRIVAFVERGDDGRGLLLDLGVGSKDCCVVSGLLFVGSYLVVVSSC